MDARLAALLDKQEIEEVVLRYCRGIDRRDFDRVRDCYHADALDHHGSFSGSVDEFLEWVERLTGRYDWTMHLVGNVLVELGPAASSSPMSNEAATQAAVCETYGVSLHRGDPTKPHLNLATGFRYLDRFERRDASGWKIAERTAIGEWSMRVPPEIYWEIPPEHLHGQRNASDLVYSMLARLSAPPERDGGDRGPGAKD
jgi:hypothetical protein